MSSFRGTGVPENEGQHLQDVYPPARHHGGPGKFALRPRAHLTESSPLVADGARARLWRSWSPHWDLDKPVLLEKSPPNLVQARFLQALFPDARFLMMVRHPIAVSYATKKWSRSSMGTLLRHWVAAHEVLLSDLPLLKRIRIVRYEDLVADPSGVMAQVFDFLGVEDHGAPPAVRAGLNARYLERWHSEDGGIVARRRLARHERRFASHAAPFGYLLRSPFCLPSPDPAIAPHFLPRHTG